MSCVSISSFSEAATLTTSTISGFIDFDEPYTFDKSEASYNLILGIMLDFY